MSKGNSVRKYTGAGHRGGFTPPCLECGPSIRPATCRVCSAGSRCSHNPKARWREALMSHPRIAIAAFAVIAAMRPGGPAEAAEVRILSSGSMKGALSQLLPDFQKSSGNTAMIEYGPAGAIVGRIQKDGAADVVIVSRSQLQKLESEGKVVQGSLVNIAGIALGVAVRKGAAKPDISKAA